jgi:hypothetical protein
VRALTNNEIISERAGDWNLPVGRSNVGNYGVGCYVPRTRSVTFAGLINILLT